jgi:putative ABC transport system substrate-binding protein
MTVTGGPYYRALFDELRRLGYVEGQNLRIERYSGGGRAEKYASLARDVVRSRPDLIFTQTTRLVSHFKAATASIPIVAYLSDPVAHGLVASLARPGGNITGIMSDAGLEIYGKSLELLKEAAHALSRIGFLNPHSLWDQPIGQATREAAERLGVVLIPAPLNGFQEADYRQAIAALKEQGADALLVGPVAENYSNRQLIVALAAQTRLPALYPDRIFVEAGGLMSYGFDLPALYRRVAHYTTRS